MFKVLTNLYQAKGKEWSESQLVSSREQRRLIGIIQLRPSSILTLIVLIVSSSLPIINIQTTAAAHSAYVPSSISDSCSVCGDRLSTHVIAAPG